MSFPLSPSQRLCNLFFFCVSWYVSLSSQGNLAAALWRLGERMMGACMSRTVLNPS